MSNSINLIGKRLSFYQLFNETKLVIEIPTIQRDYAQGRKNKHEVRDLFLHALYSYLKENKPEQDLDFVYGSTEIKNGITNFIPLDGQQRLTTLFLLHWYLAARSGNMKEFRELMLLNNISKFTYLTRPSSSEFLNALLINEPTVDGSSQFPAHEHQKLSDTIKDQGWYFLSWSYDPNIQSMLTMLDSIHYKFHDHSYFYERLVNDKNPIITFQYLDLKEFGLTEDLYIKMNSRGKPLTSFENFKAKLERHISSLFGEKDKPFTISNSKIKASYKEYFSFQIDTYWANLFWQYKHLIGKPHTFDEELMNFIRVIIANQYAIENTGNISVFKEIAGSGSATTELTESISYYKFRQLEALTKNFVIYLIEAFDCLANGEKPIINHFPDNFYFREKELFEKALKYDLSWPERALFHAYLRYLITHKAERENFAQWMRVVYNLIENSRIESAEELVIAIGSIEKLLVHSGNILHYLISIEAKDIDFFANWQVDEEIIKAHLILKSSEWKLEIEDYEKHGFHKGQIGYLLEFSDVLNYYIKNKNCDWPNEENRTILNKFKFYASRSIALFRIFDTPENKEYSLERALLTKGNYLIPANNNRYNFGSSKHTTNYQRDYSWKRMLRFTETLEHWKTKRMYVKELLDDKRLDITKIKTSLELICKDTPDDWRGYFTKNSRLLNYCSQGFIHMPNNSEIELYNASQQNHYHIDMYIYNFYLTYIEEDKTLFKPFEKITYESVKNSEDYSHALFEDWCFKKKNYYLNIYRVDGKFLIEFKKAKGNKHIEEYHQEVIDVLKAKKFKWIEDENLFSLQTVNELGLLSVLKKLCAELKILSSVKEIS